jgi:hypothetical protein
MVEAAAEADEDEDDSNRQNPRLHSLLLCSRDRGERAAMAGLMAEVVEDHVRTHLVDVDKHPNALRQSYPTGGLGSQQATTGLLLERRVTSP